MKVFSPSMMKSSRPAPSMMPNPQMSNSLTPQQFGSTMDDVLNRSRVSRSISIANAERPSNLMYRYNGQTTYWYMYALMDWYVSEVSVLSTIIQRSTSELLRYGIEFEPKFICKCEDCDYELQNFSQKCPKCGGTHLRPPNPKQMEYFRRPNRKSFLDEANDNGQSLKDVVKAYAESEYQNNQAYMLCITGDLIDSDDGALVQNYPLEFISQDPKYVKFLYDETGKPGTQFAFTRDDRNVMLDLVENPEKEDMYSSQGKVLYPAYWQVGQNYGATGPSWFYTQEEIYQDKWFKQGMIYGMPIWYDIEDDLLAFHYLEKHFLKKYQFGYVRKIVILPGFNDVDAERIAMGVKDVLAKNDNSIPIICTPPSLPGTPEMQAQTLELGTESSEDALRVKDDIRDRLCAHAGVPNIFAGDVEESGGMNNESQQITLFDRYLMDKLDRIDNLLAWILGWFPEITDYILVVNRPSKADAANRRRTEELEFASQMKQLGFDVKFVDGHFYFSEEPVEQVQRRQQEAMQQQQAQMQQMMPPGQGGGEEEDPREEHGDKPDKGTARREDMDIGAAADEIDESKDEAESAMGGM